MKDALGHGSNPRGSFSQGVDTATHASHLTSVSRDNAAFDSVIAGVEGNRAITKDMMHQIASQYLGYSPRASSRAALVKVIRDTQMLAQRQEARGREIDRVNKAW